MIKTFIAVFVVLSAVQSKAADFDGLPSMLAGDAAALEIVLPLPAKPALSGAQLLQRFDLVRNQLRLLRSGGDRAASELRRLESQAFHLGSSGSQHLTFQNDMMRLSSDLARLEQETRNAYHAVVNLLPFAKKDRELALRADEMEKAAVSLSMLEMSAMRLESAVASAPPENIGYTAQARAREIARQAGLVCDQARELRLKTAELVLKTAL